MRHTNQALPRLGYRSYLLNLTFNQQDTLVNINDCKQLLEGQDLYRGTASMQTTAVVNSDQQLPRLSQNEAKKKNNVITVPNGINFEIATTSWGSDRAIQSLTVI
jgi:RNase P/RNase MRP subunit p30